MKKIVPSFPVQDLPRVARSPISTRTGDEAIDVRQGMRQARVNGALQRLQELVVGCDNGRLRVFREGQEECIVDDHTGFERDSCGTRASGLRARTALLDPGRILPTQRPPRLGVDLHAGAATYLKRTPKAFEKVVAQGEISKHYLTERGILFSRKELDGWLMGR